MDGRVLLVAAVFAAVFYVGEAAVAGIKKVDRAVAHGVKTAGKVIAHVFHYPNHPPDEAP